MTPTPAESPPTTPAEPGHFPGRAIRSPRTRPHRKAPDRAANPVPIQLPLFPEMVALTRIRPDRNERRYYRIEIWADLFGRTALARIWGRLGSSSRLRLDPYPDIGTAIDALAKLAKAKRRRGYQDQAVLPW